MSDTDDNDIIHTTIWCVCVCGHVHEGVMLSREGRLSL